MEIERHSRLAQRGILLLVVVGSVTVFRVAALDAVTLAKASIVLGGVALLVIISAAKVGVTGRLHLPAGAAPYVVVAFLLALLVAAVGSYDLVGSLVGPYRRYTGAVTYTAYVGLFLGVLISFRAEHLGRLLAALLVAGAIVVSYALIQWVGWDWVTWTGQHRGVVSTLGNENFVSAYAGMLLPLTVVGALRRAWDPPYRVASGALALATVATLPAAVSIQGFPTAGIGLSMVAIAWLLGRGRYERLGVTVVMAAVALSLLLVGAGAANRGPAAFLSEQPGVELRKQYWSVAAAMFVDQPLTGVGIGQYVSYFRLYRAPQDASGAATIRLEADSAHNVPLQMFAEGGIVLGVAYLAVVLAVGFALTSGLRRARGERRLLLGGFGGAWAGYQFQSAISIDVPPLAATHWVLAAAVVVTAGAVSLREFRLPWAVPEGPRGKLKRRVERRTRIALAGVVVIGVGMVSLASVPMIADLAAGEGIARARAGDIAGASEAFERSERLAPWNPWYPFEHGKALYARAPEAALDRWERAARIDPRGIGPVMSSARLAAQLDHIDRARAWYEQALEIEPHHPDVLTEVARFELSAGHEGRAEDLLERALAVDAEHEEARETLAAIQGDV